MKWLRNLSILQYHNVTERHHLQRLWLPIRAFSEHLTHFFNIGYKLVSLDDAIAFMEKNKNFSERTPISLTFDHGYEEFYHEVFPIIKEKGIAATVFICPDKIGKRISTNGDAITYLNKRQLLEIAENGIQVGAYEDFAWNINKIHAATVKKHIREYKSQLQELLGREINYFGVKEGVPSPEIRDLLKASGYRAFLTQCPTFRRPDLFAIGRIQVDDDDFNIFLTKISRMYLFFKDRRSWRAIRKFKMDRVAHRLSETFDKVRGRSK